MFVVIAILMAEKMEKQYLHTDIKIRKERWFFGLLCLFKIKMLYANAWFTFFFFFQIKKNLSFHLFCRNKILRFFF